MSNVPYFADTELLSSRRDVCFDARVYYRRIIVHHGLVTRRMGTHRESHGRVEAFALGRHPESPAGVHDLCRSGDCSWLLEQTIGSVRRHPFSRRVGRLQICDADDVFGVLGGEDSSFGLPGSPVGIQGPWVGIVVRDIPGAWCSFIAIVPNT